MPKATRKNSPFTFLKSTMDVLHGHPQLYYPFLWASFIYLVVLELAYFAPRFPLSVVFKPLIVRVWGPQYMHYPMDLNLLQDTFYYAQIALDLFAGTFILSAVCRMVAAVNNDEKPDFKKTLRKIAPSYIHVLLYTLFSLILFLFSDFLYGLVIKRAQAIQSSKGVYFLLKKTIILGAPYVQFFVSILLTALLVYVLPIIINERKKLFPALLQNFKLVFGSIRFTFLIVFIPTVFYLPVLLLRNNVGLLANATMPEIQFVLLALGVLTITAINAFVMAAATVTYLYHKEK